MREKAKGREGGREGGRERERERERESDLDTLTDIQKISESSIYLREIVRDTE